MPAPADGALAFSELRSAVRGEAVQVLQQAGFDAVPIRNRSGAQTKRVAFALRLCGMRHRAQRSYDHDGEEKIMATAFEATHSSARIRP
jgi:hypothetical protein